MAEGIFSAVRPSASGAAGRRSKDDGYSASDDDYSTVTPGSDTESHGLSSDLQDVTQGSGAEVPADSDANTSSQWTSLIVSKPTAESTSSSDSSGTEAAARRREQPTIPHQLPKLVARILRSKEVGEKIARKLRTYGISFKFDETHDTTIHVKPSIKLDRVKSVLEKDLCQETFRVQEGNLEDRVIMQALNSKEVQDQMVMEYETGTLSIVYHSSIEGNISTDLEKLRNLQKQLPLSFESARFLERHMRRFMETFHNRLNYQVKMALVGGRSNSSCLAVTCNKTQSQDAFSKAEKHIASLGQTDVEVSLATGLYLQSRLGECVLKDMEEKHHCLLSVETPVQRVLLRASRSNNQLLVCESNMVATDCHVIVLPLCDGQKEWPPHYKHIMERGDCNMWQTGPHKISCSCHRVGRDEERVGGGGTGQS